MVNSYSIANSVLKRAVEDNEYLTPLKLHCLIYLLFSYYLYITGNKLLNERFEIVDGCPVLSSLYYKINNNSVIIDYIKDALDNVYYIKGVQFKQCLEFVWNKYKAYNGKNLLVLITRKHSAYEKAMKNNFITLQSSDILNEEILRNEKILKKAKEYRDNIKD